jgi:hypothetical protein
MREKPFCFVFMFPFGPLEVVYSQLSKESAVSERDR